MYGKQLFLIVLGILLVGLIIVGCGGDVVKVEKIEKISNSSGLIPENVDFSKVVHWIDARNELVVYHGVSWQMYQRAHPSIRNWAMPEGTYLFVCDADRGAPLIHKIPSIHHNHFGRLAVELGVDGLGSIWISEGDIITVVNCHVYFRGKSNPIERVGRGTN